MAQLQYEVNYKIVTIKTSDGSIITGKLNIHGCHRLSDYFKEAGEKFIAVILEQTEDSAKNNITLVNKEHVIWVNTQD